MSALFIEGILSILRSNAIKINYPSELRLDYDIVRYAFRGKSKTAHDGVSMLYEKNNFCRLELLTYWWYYLNELGEGIAVDFPTKLKTSLTHSKKYFMSCSGQIKLVPNFPVEKVVIFQQNSM